MNADALAPGVLPELWSDDSISVEDVLKYFAGGGSVVIPRDGYEESCVIPACPRSIVENAISEAVHKGLVWLVSGPASIQAEEVPADTLATINEILKSVKGKLHLK